MEIGDWLESAAIGYRVAADGKRQALGAVADLAGRAFHQPPSAVLEALLERERESSTGVGHGVALPHAILPGLGRLRGVFVRLEQPVDFGAVDDQPVDLLFALFAPTGAGSEHLRALARVSRLLRQAKLRGQLRQARSADALHAFLSQETTVTAA